jgi:hypothetical protein
MTNQNQELIDNLREAATYLESRENLPTLTKGWGGGFSVRLFGRTTDASHFMDVAKNIGSFKKDFSDNDVEINLALAPNVSMNYSIKRENLGCKKLVTWECPEGLESFLKKDSEEEVEVTS